jgi:hypothetical protein
MKRGKKTRANLLQQIKMALPQYNHHSQRKNKSTRKSHPKRFQKNRKNKRKIHNS